MFILFWCRVWLMRLGKITLWLLYLNLVKSCILKKALQFLGGFKMKGKRTARHEFKQTATAPDKVRQFIFHRFRINIAEIVNCREILRILCNTLHQNAEHLLIKVIN